MKLSYINNQFGASLVAQWWRIHLPMQEVQVWSLDLEDPLEEEMATHSSILTWKIPWMEESGGLQSMVSQKNWIQLSSSAIATEVVLIWKMRMFCWVCDSSGLSSDDINAPPLFLYSSQPVFPFWEHIIFKNFSCSFYAFLLLLFSC